MNGTVSSENYKRVSQAIDFIRRNFKSQPGLDEIAANVSLSPFHFQKIFTDWAGISPKQFLKYITVEYTRRLLQEKHTLSEAAFESGLSGTGRLHDLYVSIEKMTPGEYKNSGEGLTITYCFEESSFGELLIASTSKGICHLAFVDDRDASLQLLRNKFPKANFEFKTSPENQNVLKIFNKEWNNIEKIKLHLRGTEFQIKVWEALLKIPTGKLSSYGQLAEKINLPNASRAVGTAIGDNPIAYLIPCHRVIKSTGIIGDYMWGTNRKTAIIGWEAAQINVREDL